MPLGARLSASLSRLIALGAVCGAVFLTDAPTVAGQSLPARSYVEGETDRYEIRLQVAGAGSELFAVSLHRVVLQNGIAAERVRWVRASETVVGDLSDEARRIPPFELSLDSRASPTPAPTVANPAFQMLVDSLHLIYIAVNPSLGASQLQAPGDIVTSATPYVEDGFEIPGAHLERWAASLTFALVSADAEEVVIRAKFLPPLSAPWSPYRDWMEADCGGRPGNFEALVGDGKGFVAGWGCERSEVTARVSVQTGKVTYADLESRIRFHRRPCSDDALSKCGEATEGEMVVRATLLLKRTDPPLAADRLTLNPSDGLEYVKAPAGAFYMGCVPGDSECYPRERPRHAVRISEPFWIGRTEVPVAAYERFVSENDLLMPSEPGDPKSFNDPIVKVTWHEAEAYCTWAGGRLPTEAEWEYAARGGLDGLKYPWGNERSHDEANFWRSGAGDVGPHAAQVASFPANGFGLYDMAGNVYEWTADWFDEEYYRRSPALDPRGPDSGRFRAVRGGAGFINPAVLRISTRLRNAPDARRLGVGFRCVLDRKP